VDEIREKLVVEQRKTATEGWDKWLPMFFSHTDNFPRKQQLRFSPFELVYGREVRGPLDVIKESWEIMESSEYVASEVLQMREKFEKGSGNSETMV
jgi:hypothetical protein